MAAERAHPPSPPTRGVACASPPARHTRAPLCDALAPVARWGWALYWRRLPQERLVQSAAAPCGMARASCLRLNRRRPSSPIDVINGQQQSQIAVRCYQGARGGGWSLSCTSSQAEHRASQTAPPPCANAAASATGCGGAATLGHLGWGYQGGGRRRQRVISRHRLWSELCCGGSGGGGVWGM